VHNLRFGREIYEGLNSEMDENNEDNRNDRDRPGGAIGEEEVSK